MPEITAGQNRVFYRKHATKSTNAGQIIDDASDADRPPLILVHGAGGTLMNWPPNMRRLPDTQVYALDLPGHGRSGGPGLKSIAAYREMVLDFADALDLPRFVITGHSMGSAVAMEMALNVPDRLAGLVLVGANARLAVAPSILAGLRDQYDETCVRLVKLLFSPGADRRLSIGYLRYLSLLDKDLLRDDFAACDAFDLTDRMQSIRTPTLIICGANDRMTPPAASRFLHEQIADSCLELIDDSGHMVMLEQPQAIASEVIRFIDAITARQAK